MKKYFLPIIVVSILILPAISYGAIDLNKPGSASNPYIFQEQKTNEQIADDLKGKYGISKFYDCYTRSGYSPEKDTSDPQVVTRLLTATKYCLELGVIQEEKKQQQKEVDEQKNKQCQSSLGEKAIYFSAGDYCMCLPGYWEYGGKCVSYEEKKCLTYNKYVSKSSPDGQYIWVNNQCLSYGAICRQKYGSSSIFKSIDTTGNISCDCKVGSQWNGQKTSCISKPKTCTKGYRLNKNNKCIK